MNIQKPLKITKGNDSNRICPSPLRCIINFCQINMNVFATFDEIPSMTPSDIKETVYTKAIKNYKGK